MFLEPKTLGQEGVGLMGWCPVSWLWRQLEGLGLYKAPAPSLPERPPVCTSAPASVEGPPMDPTSGVPLLAFPRGAGPPWLLSTCLGGPRPRGNPRV